MEPHDEFLELCAISTAGELSAQEQRKLREHLTGCAECRRALKEFEAAVEVGIPLLASRLSTEHARESVPVQAQPAKSHGTSSPGIIAPLPQVNSDACGTSDAAEPGFVFAQRERPARKPMNWNYVWFSFAACVLLTIALGVYAYRIGKGRSVAATPTFSSASDAQIEALEQQISDAGRDRDIGGWCDPGRDAQKPSRAWGAVSS